MSWRGRIATTLTYLGLDKVGGDDFAAVAVEEGEGGAKRRGRDTPEDSLSNDPPPSWLSCVNGYDVKD